MDGASKQAQNSDCRRMVRAELMGRHSHTTRSKIVVHVWSRDGKFLARGRHRGNPFGRTLGADIDAAECQLRHLLVEIDNGAFQRKSETRHCQIATGPTPRLTIRQGCDAFLTEKRRLRGKKTAENYRARLTPLLEFAEHPDVRPRWPWLESLNREFAIEYRAFLNRRTTSRNGHSAAEPKLMAPRQIVNVLSCVNTLLNWARSPHTNCLPPNFVSPFTKEIVGSKPRKDPLRAVIFPPSIRVGLIENMDPWELSHFAIAMTLPLRPEDYTGLLISEVDWSEGMLRFGTRLDGRDFNKGGQEFSSPFPREIEPLLRYCVGNRPAGPLLRSKVVFEGRRPASITLNSHGELVAHFQRRLSQSPAKIQQAPQDAKLLFRKMLVECGGISVDAMSRAFKKLLERNGQPATGRFYDLRGSVSTGLERSGVSHLVQRYVTGHTTTDILNEYVSLDPKTEMRKYFESIDSLLNAIAKRAMELGIPGFGR